MSSGWATQDGVGKAVNFSLASPQWFACAAALIVASGAEYMEYLENKSDMDQIANLRYQMDSAIRELQRANTSQSHKDYWENILDGLLSQEQILANNIAQREGFDAERLLLTLTACAAPLRYIKLPGWPPFS